MTTDAFVKILRKQMTDAERLLWMHLRAHRLLDEKFRRQQPIGPYIADFVHFRARLIVEADGGHHNASTTDPKRDAWFAAQGFRILRFWNHEILSNIEAVLEAILKALQPEALPLSPTPRCFAPPSPQPLSREGRGAQAASGRAPIPHAQGERGSKASIALRPLPAARLAVGLSGGLDSTVLLHLLAMSPVVRERGLRAIHVHHGLHADADAWAVHCEAICAALDVPLQVLRVQVDRTDGRGPEGAARAARLRAFGEAIDAHELLALAHHRDDQAETVLLRLLRGAGGDGLAAMRRRSRLGALHLWRPLLDVPRAALREHASAHRLHWIEDPSNADAGFDRNFLRHQVLPLLAQRWPQASRNLARSAALLAEQSLLLATTTDAQLDAPQVAPSVLSLPGLLAQPRAQRARILRAWLLRLDGHPPPARILAAIERDLLRARRDGDARVAWADIVVHGWRDRLYAMNAYAALPADWSIIWDASAPLQLPDGALLALRGADRFDMPVTARARQGGERIRLPGREHSHALKHVLQERDVPPWTRVQMPLLFADDGELLAAGDSVLSARMDAWLLLHGASLHWIPAARRDAAAD